MLNDLLLNVKCKLESILQQGGLSQFPSECPENVLFFVISDGITRAHIEIATGKSFEDSWQKGVAVLKKWRTKNWHKPIWLRVETVNNIEPLRWEELKLKLSRAKRNYFRFGLSLSPNFKTAILEHELYANAVLYKTDVSVATPNDTNLKNFSKRRFRKELQWPINNDELVYRFKTIAVFTDGNETYEIESDGKNSGYRKLDQWNVDTVTDLIEISSAYLAKQVKSNGFYHYGWFPCFDRPIPTYNALRHASSTYALLEGWEVTKKEDQKKAIDQALHYLTNELIKVIELPDGSSAAFLVDTGDEIKLGGNAVSILAFAKYTEITGDQKYLKMMELLALGILFMQKPETGEYIHILNYPDLSVKSDNRTIYYDGEAAFGLMRLYGITKDVRWIQSVEKAFDYFIENKHWQAHDHWQSYCVNELTLYNPDPKYYQFGLDNIRDHLDFVLARITTYPTLLELMMAAQKMIVRIQSDSKLAYLLNDFDVKKFYQALEYRARYLLNGFFYPEVAMFFKNPQRILGGFFIRHHAFRVRIDDVEHYLSGYVAYRKYLQILDQGSKDKKIESFMSSGKPQFKISIIIPVYDRAQTIVRCLDSIAAQTLSQDLFEVIIIDDGSKDESIEIIDNYKKIDNLRLIILPENSGGASKPRNRGIEEALGQYIIFIDSDDIITEKALELALELAINGNLDMVAIPILFGEGRKAYTTLFYDYPDGIKRVLFSEDENIGQLVFSNPGVIGRLYRTDLLQQSKIRFSEKLRIYEDTLFSRFIFSVSSSFGMIPINQAHYEPMPAINDGGNLSLLKRTVDKCVVYILETIRICEEMDITILNEEKKTRILNNSFCRNNIFNTLNCPEGYRALSVHINILLPYLYKEGIRKKAKKLIENVEKDHVMQKNIRLAEEYFSTNKVDTLSDIFVKAWCWEREILVLDFNIKGYRFGFDIKGGNYQISLVLRGDSMGLEIDWGRYGTQEENHINLFDCFYFKNIEAAFLKVIDIVNSLRVEVSEL